MFTSRTAAASHRAMQSSAAAELEMLGQGAEAKVWKSAFCGRPCVSVPHPARGPATAARARSDAMRSPRAAAGSGRASPADTAAGSAGGQGARGEAVPAPRA